MTNSTVLAIIIHWSCAVASPTFTNVGLRSANLLTLATTIMNSLKLNIVALQETQLSLTNRATHLYKVARLTSSTVNLCALDISKAFDRLNHHGLFVKLIVDLFLSHYRKF